MRRHPGFLHTSNQNQRAHTHITYTVLALANAAKADAETKSDDMSSAFQDGDMNIDDFVKQVRVCRNASRM